MLPVGNPVRQLVTDVAGLLHADKYLDGARLTAEWLTKTTGITYDIPDKKAADSVLILLLHWLFVRTR